VTLIFLVEQLANRFNLNPDNVAVARDGIPCNLSSKIYLSGRLEDALHKYLW